MPNFHRRIYFLVSKPNLVLIHYLNDVEEEAADDMESPQSEPAEIEVFNMPMSDILAAAWFKTSAEPPSPPVLDTQLQFHVATEVSPNPREIVDFSPEWSQEEGGTKVLVIGNWDFEQSPGLFCTFDGILVPANVIQPGVLRTFCPGELSLRSPIQQKKSLANPLKLTFSLQPTRLEWCAWPWLQAMSSCLT